VIRDRHLDWDGSWNARDLGGLPAAGGRRTRWGAVVRADAPDRLTSAGWSALEAHGIRTIVDLRNDDERTPDLTPRPAGLATVRLPLDGIEDTTFWDVWAPRPPPLYYRPFLERFPRRVAGVIAAVAQARPGGVLVHCVGGRDRTGLVALLLLRLVGVGPDDIAADHGLSDDRLRPWYASLGEPDQGAEITELLEREGTSAELVVSMLASLDVEGGLRAGGLSDDDLAAVRARLLSPAARAPGPSGPGVAGPPSARRHS
jgi:protein-tyrosine phosphatase